MEKLLDLSMEKILDISRITLLLTTSYAVYVIATSIHELALRI